MAGWKIVGENGSECGQWHSLRIKTKSRTFWIGWCIPERRWADSKDRADLEKKYPGILYELRQVVPG